MHLIATAARRRTEGHRSHGVQMPWPRDVSTWRRLNTGRSWRSRTRDQRRRATLAGFDRRGATRAAYGADADDRQVAPTIVEGIEMAQLSGEPERTPGNRRVANGNYFPLENLVTTLGDGQRPRRCNQYPPRGLEAGAKVTSYPSNAGTGAGGMMPGPGGKSSCSRWRRRNGGANGAEIGTG